MEQSKIPGSKPLGAPRDVREVLDAWRGRSAFSVCAEGERNVQEGNKGVPHPEERSRHE